MFDESTAGSNSSSHGGEDESGRGDRILLREGVTLLPRVYQSERLNKISQDTQIEGRNHMFTVLSSEGGTLFYQGSNTEEWVDFCIQTTDSAAGTQVYISVETEGGGFTHLPLHAWNKQEALTLLESNLTMMQTGLEDNGVNFGKSTLAKDVLGLFIDGTPKLGF